MPEEVANISAAEREATEMQRRIWEKLAKLVQLSGSWVVSRPGQKILCFETLVDNNSLIEKLDGLGFSPVFIGTRDRTFSNGLHRVNIFEIRAYH